MLHAKGRMLSLRTISAALTGAFLFGTVNLLLKPSSYTLDIQDPPTIFTLDSQSYVQGPPTQRFRDNLRNDTRYITSWGSAGWTNDVMTYANLIYLALITERTPIIPKFLSHHIDPSAPPFVFGEVFDLPRLSQAIGIHLLEWHEVKDPESQVVDDLGCWSVWETVQYHMPTPEPRQNPSLKFLKLDISWTQTPPWVELISPSERDNHASFWSLASLAFPDARSNSLASSLNNHPSPQHQVSLPPDDHLLCFDLLYFISAHRTWEWEFDFSPAWRFVGQHMRWTASMERLADSYVRRTLNVPANQPTPPYVSIHIRHGDFHEQCGEVPVDQCFAPLSVIARRVSEVQEELRTRKGIEARHVIMTSDERDPEWWSEVRALGWTWVDHAAERTGERYGKWHPVFIDAIVQSNGAGFVGTLRSTMSTLARRRVQSWHDGATRTVLWGWPGADDH
ncbi:hypothetical protein BDR03DRAFT_1092124 [Suillus americanus]|nr:hypothetical protein BDR03DRAFT_1092124 [Suillus americanus]